MSIICPSITASNEHNYRTQVERVEKFAKRIHIDLSDGVFAPSKLINLSKIWWPDKTKADIHLMCVNPVKTLSKLIDLKPSLVIFHAEAEGNYIVMAETLRVAGIKVGIALLPDTSADFIEQAKGEVDHVLIFAGKLGYYGGVADLSQIEKVKKIKALLPDVEIGWDGGVNEENVKQLSEAGVDVLNVGSYIQHNESPDKAYVKLKKLVS